MKSLAVTSSRALVKVAILAAVGCALWFGGNALHAWATTSPTFALAKITVSGTHRAEDADLTRLAGLSRGLNLFQLDPAQIEKALEQHPWVRRAQARRHFPDALALRIEEHEPAAMVALGELYLLDKEGEPFKKLTAGDALDLPLVTGVTREEYVEKPEAAALRFQKALATMAAFEDALPDGSKERVSEVRLEGTGDLTVVTTLGTEVRLGADASSEKLSRLARVRSELQKRGQAAEVIHLDNRVRPGWVTVKLSTPPSERRHGSN